MIARRSALLGLLVLLPVAAFGVTANDVEATLSNIETSPIRPYTLFGLKIVNDVLTSVAIESGVPPLVLAGTTLKLGGKGLDLTADVAEHALEHQDEIREGQLALLGEDTAKLKALKQAGKSMHSDEAQALIREIEGNARAIRAPGEGLLGYQATVLLQNAPYAAVEVAKDKIIEKMIGKVLDASGVAKYVDDKLNVYDGVHDRLARPWAGFGRQTRSWAKLDDRAAKVAAAASKALAEQEAAAVAKLLKATRESDLDSASGSALKVIYDTLMIQNPSDRREIRVEKFRLAAAQAAVLAMPAPPPRAAPAAAVAVPAALPITAFHQDPQVRVIDADDGLVRRYTREPRFTAQPTQPAPRMQQPAESAETQAWRQRMHEEMAKIGDGKTFAVCSNGCPNSSSSWDGARGQTLRDR